MAESGAVIGFPADWTPSSITLTQSGGEPQRDRAENEKCEDACPRVLRRCVINPPIGMDKYWCKDQDDMCYKLCELSPDHTIGTDGLGSTIVFPAGWVVEDDTPANLTTLKVKEGG